MPEVQSEPLTITVKGDPTECATLIAAVESLLRKSFPRSNPTRPDFTLRHRDTLIQAIKTFYDSRWVEGVFDGHISANPTDSLYAYTVMAILFGEGDDDDDDSGDLTQSTEQERRQERHASIMRSMDYADFLKTPYWHLIRKVVLERNGYKCTLCRGKSNLQVHHTTYENQGREHEHLEDLTTLCNYCHARFHDKPIREVVDA